jgi:hypothetical protein
MSDCDILTLLPLDLLKIINSNTESLPGLSKTCKQLTFLPINKSYLDTIIKNNYHPLLAWLKPDLSHESCALCSIILSKGRIDMLKTLHALGCPWDEDCCTFATENGDFGLLKWLVREGCPWDQNTTEAAARNGRLDIVQWALENDCPYDESMFAAAYEEGHYDVLNWLEEEGYNN